MEIWKPVQDFPRYEVSNLGRVRNVTTALVLKPMETRCHYLRVDLCRNGVRSVTLVHRIVAAAFCPHPTGKNIVNHINLNKKDNRADNLEWCTQSENVRHYWNSKTELEYALERAREEILGTDQLPY